VSGLKHHIHPNCRIPRLGEKAAGVSEGIATVPAGSAVGAGVKRDTIHTIRCKVIHVSAVVVAVGMIRRHVTRVAVMDTGLEKTTCCQPEGVSPVKVAVASLLPVLV
jgi:hypothetical protein